VPRRRDENQAPEPIGQPAPPARGDRRRDARLVGLGVVAVLLGWFALANRQDVRVHFWLVSATAPVVVVVAIAGVCGAALGALALRRTSGRRRRRET
jgi:uncharacterized integral membrane protein